MIQRSRLNVFAGEVEQVAGPGELDGPDGEADDDDAPAGAGERDRDDADRDHDRAEEADADLQAIRPVGLARISSSLLVMRRRHAGVGRTTSSRVSTSS